MGASLARPADRRSVFAAVSLVSLARPGGTGAANAAMVHFRARRAARWRRLVDGRLRPRRPRRSLAISAGDASRARLRDLCGADLDRAAAERAAGFAGAARGRGQGGRAPALHRRRSPRSVVGANVSRRAGRRIARRLHLQHLAADRRRLGAARVGAVVRYAAVAEFFRECADRAVRPPHARLCDLHLGAVARARRRAHGQSAGRRAAAPLCSPPPSFFRWRSAWRRCCCRCRLPSRSPTRGWRCWC